MINGDIMKKIIIILFSLISGTLLIISLLCHIATYIGYDLSEQFSMIYYVHILVIFLGIPVVLDRNSNYGIYYMKPIIAIILFGIYTLMFFIYTMLLLDGGGPEVVGTKFALVSHGRVIREIAQDEYVLYKLLVFRRITSFWIVFLATFTYQYVIRVKANGMNRLSSRV